MLLPMLFVLGLGSRGPPPSDLQNRVEVLQLSPISAEVAAAAKSGGLTIPTGVRDRAKRAWLGRGTGQLADMFLAPDSVEQIRGVSQRAAQTPMTDAMLRQMLQTPSEINISGGYRR
jgi:hypothetical protein